MGLDEADGVTVVFLRFPKEDHVDYHKFIT